MQQHSIPKGKIFSEEVTRTRLCRLNKQEWEINERIKKTSELIRILKTGLVDTIDN